ncbi:MAG: hypothetical protein IAG10_21595 [Planctomycetaceae bacterium]|nr:hypothetical protein [Planctomycetaceae bacterium]
MFAKARSVRSQVLWSICCFSAVFTASDRQFALADDAKSPSAEEKKAVAVLSEKGAVIFIDGEYQVTQILGGRDLTNADLQHLRVFKKLKVLSLSNAKIDDGAVATLKLLTQLQSLNLSAGAISEKAQEELKKALSNCRVVIPDRRSFSGGPPVPPGPPRSSTSPGERPSGWGAFEFPPLTPAPSISFEIHSPAVQARLKLTAEQKHEIGRVTGRDFQRHQTEDAIKKVLTAEQKTLLQQVLLQREGPTALVLPEVAQELRLTKDQQTAIQAVMDDRRDQLIKLGDQLRDRTVDFSKSMQETTRIKSAANDRLLAVLTASQREAWNAKIGPPLPSPSFGGSSSTQTPEETARANFRNLDRNNDDQLTTEEWQRSRSTRAKFEQAKITLELPIKVEAFVKKFLEMDRAMKESNK